VLYIEVSWKSLSKEKALGMYVWNTIHRYSAQGARYAKSMTYFIWHICSHVTVAFSFLLLVEAFVDGYVDKY
jgi:hypothetical protein